MGLNNSKAEKTLIEAKIIRQDLYARVDKCKSAYQHAFDQINLQLKSKILRCSGKQLSDLLDAHQLTSLQAVYIFIERTINVGIPNNYVLDQMFEEAIFQAIECDKQREADGYKKKSYRPGMNPQQCYPPFFGVPTSIKQTLLMKNRQTYVGYTSKVNKITNQDGLFVMMVRKMGFIPFARSNVPQACKTLQTNNNIFGYSKNPWNKNRSCGGSSGGESGMISSYCSPIGFAADVGGSLRIPGAFTGLVTIKPHNRYSKMGHCYNGKFVGGLPFQAELGVLSRTVEDTILVQQYLYNPQNYKDIPAQFRDHYMVYTPFNYKTILEPKKYKIGVIKRLKYAGCSKPNERAVDIAIQILKQKGHQVVEVDYADFQQLQKVYFFVMNLHLCDQKAHVFSELRGDEPLIKQYRLPVLAVKIPWLIRRLIMWLIAERQPRLAKMIKATKTMTIIELFQNMYDIQNKSSHKIYKVFTSNQLDALLMPSFATPAPRLGEIGKLQYFYSFSLAWNVLNYPVGTVPITVVKPDQTSFDDEFNDYFTKNVRSTMKQSEGLPVGIQVASTPYNQQKILSIMKEIEEQIKFRQNYQIPEQ